MTVTRTLVDTSTLVAALMSHHTAHAWADAHLAQAEQQTVLISTHTLAEVFKVLTTYPREFLPPEIASQVIKETTRQYEKINLDDQDYFAVMQRLADHHLSGSVIFDALTAQAALKAGAEKLLTLNPRDFKRLGKDVAGILVYP